MTTSESINSGITEAQEIIDSFDTKNCSDDIEEIVGCLQIILNNQHDIFNLLKSQWGKQ